MSGQGGVYTPHCKSYYQLNWSMHWCTHESQCRHMETCYGCTQIRTNQRTHYLYYLADYMSNTLCHAPAVNQITLFKNSQKCSLGTLACMSHKTSFCHIQRVHSTTSHSTQTCSLDTHYLHLYGKFPFHSPTMQWNQRMKAFQSSYFV